MISGERKKFGLAAHARKPRKLHPKLSNTVRCVVGDGVTHGYIRFDESLVEFIGSKLPRGLAEFDPAFIVVEAREDKWVVTAQYIQDGVWCVLWETKSKPAWLNNPTT